MREHGAGFLGTSSYGHGCSALADVEELQVVREAAGEGRVQVLSRSMRLLSLSRNLFIGLVGAASHRDSSDVRLGCWH